MRCQIAARPNVADDIGTAGAVAIPEVGHVPAAFDDTGVVALAAPPVVEVGVGVLDHPRARLVLTEAGEEAEGRTAVAGTCRVGRAVALFVADSSGRHRTRRARHTRSRACRSHRRG
jgi:hypothetical protein